MVMVTVGEEITVESCSNGLKRNIIFSSVDDVIALLLIISFITHDRFLGPLEHILTVACTLLLHFWA